MKVYAMRLSSYGYFPTVRVLPELTLSFERNPDRDLYVSFGWLIVGFEFHFCFCRRTSEASQGKRGIDDRTVDQQSAPRASGEPMTRLEEIAERFICGPCRP